MTKSKSTLPRSKFATVKVTDANVTVGSSIYDKYHRDRYDYDRQHLISDALRAFRLNPLARRIVKLYREFSIGTNLAVEVIDPKSRVTGTKKFTRAKSAIANDFIHQFWKHPVNAMDEQIPEWFDERTLTGNLFVLFSVDPSGMPLVRAIPTEEITGIITRDNDYRQEVSYKTGVLDEVTYQAYDPAGTNKPPFVRHYVINRPVGSTWGESDLFPILPWIARYNSWLENRTFLNYYRSLFAWVLSGDFKSEAERQARQKELEANPPKPNSLLVKNASEEWSTLAPNLDSYEAAQDGLAIKKTIAIGAGIPLHYLAEPESSTRTTAEAAGTPTFKNFNDYQQSFFNILRDVLTIACMIRRQVDPTVLLNPEFAVHGQDISERDNSLLALAVNRVMDPLNEMYDRHMIDTKEYLRLAYFFAGEVYDEDQEQKEGLRRPLSNKTPSSNPSQSLHKSEPIPSDDPEEKEVKPT